MHGWEEIHCRGFFLLFQISSNSIQTNNNIKYFFVVAKISKMSYTKLETEITATTSPKNFMKAYIESADHSLFVITYFIFFGCMVCKKFAVEVCIFSFKYHQISIEIHQNLKFVAFS